MLTRIYLWDTYFVNLKKEYKKIIWIQICIQIKEGNNTISENLKNGRDFLNKVNNDPFVKILLKNSQFTQIQLETLLIDIFLNQFNDLKASDLDKVNMRTSNRKITRGSFNRTLQQARKNMIKSILTILLLGYLGILESPMLSPFMEASNKLNEYINDFIRNNKEGISLDDKRRINNLSMFEERLKNLLNELIFK